MEALFLSFLNSKQYVLIEHTLTYVLAVVFQEALLFKENMAHLSGGGRFFNATFQVSACTVAGCGPWSQPVLVMPASGQ
uniref:SJCHGC07724 protein n=1 Tax=Schistosoma japonicum TaxID=6182 RepID=Q5BRN9_SCHJA|nr:SJCHGC07724 protein [Schistosoma japonicum]